MAYMAVPWSVWEEWKRYARAPAVPGRDVLGAWQPAETPSQKATWSPRDTLPKYHGSAKQLVWRGKWSSKEHFALP